MMDGVGIDLCIERAVAAKATADTPSARSDWRDVLKSAADFVLYRTG
jgi:hypothetical protein